MVDIGLAGDLDFQGGKRGLVLDVGGYYERDHVRAVAHDQPFGNRRGHGLLDQLISRAKRA